MGRIQRIFRFSRKILPESVWLITLRSVTASIQVNSRLLRIIIKCGLTYLSERHSYRRLDAWSIRWSSFRSTTCPWLSAIYQGCPKRARTTWLLTTFKKIDQRTLALFFYPDFSFLVGIVWHLPFYQHKSCVLYTFAIILRSHSIILRLILFHLLTHFWDFNGIFSYFGHPR